MEQPSIELNLSVPESWRESLIKRKAGYGLVEIFCHPGSSLLEAAAFTVALAPLAVDSSWAFPQFALIFPTTEMDPADVQGLEVDLWRHISDLLATRVPSEGQQRALAILRKRTRVIMFNIHDTDILMNTVRNLPARTALFISHGELFSSASVLPRQTSLRTPTPMGEELHMQLIEDIWVPQVHYAAGLLGVIASEKMLYIVFRVAHFQPERPENLQLLESIDQCNIIAARPAEGGDFPYDDYQRWIKLIRQGHTIEAFTEIDARTDLSALNRAFLKAQCLLATGQGILAFRYIEPFRNEMIHGGDPHLLLSVSRMALYAGKLDDASDFLLSALQQPMRDAEALITSLQVAKALQMSRHTAAIQDELVRRYPNSEPALREALVPLLRERRFGEIEAKLEPIVQGGAAIGYVRYMHFLAQTLGKSVEPDYDYFIKQVQQNGLASPSVAALDSVFDLFKRQLTNRAVEMVARYDWEPAFMKHAVDLAMRGMQKLLIARRRDQELENEENLLDQLRKPFVLVLRYLSDHPDDGERRVDFARLLAPEGAGLIGFMLLTDSVLQAQPQSNCGPEVRHSTPDLPDDFDKTVLSRLLPKDGPVLLGVGELSLDGIPYTPAELLAIISKMLEYLSVHVNDEEDVKSITLLLHVGLLLLKREERFGSEDLRLMMLAGTGLCNAGYFQYARDLAERGLKIAEGREPAGKRKAWLLFADMYLRVHNRLESLLGLACARQQTNTQPTLDDAYAETVLVARILRDLGPAFREPALKAIASIREILSTNLLDTANSHKTDTLECSIEIQAMLAQLATGEVDAKISLDGLGERLVDIIERSVSRHDDLVPPMVILAQVISYAMRLGVAIEPHIRETFELRLLDLPKVKRDMMVDLSRSKLSSLPQSFEGWALGRVRFAQDLASDLAFRRILARRFLVEAKTMSAESVAFALEWLADHSISNVDERLEKGARDSLEESVALNLLQWASLGSVRANSQVLAQLQEFALRVEARHRERSDRLQPRLPESPEETARFLVGLSQHLDVHLVGLDHERRLVHVTASKGALGLMVETLDVFQHKKYLAWRQEYPYSYGVMNTSAPEGLSDVERSMAGLGIYAPAGGRPSLLVLDTDLQDLPVNLVLVNGELAGISRPMASTPALSWLRACHLVSRPSTSRKVAWVSTAVPSTDELGPLLFLATDIQEVCSRHGFTVSNAAVPPQELCEADVAVIGAHGVLHAGGQFFQAISDEATTRLTGRDIARYAAGAGVVVLFVCSGGRIDRDFLSDATVGLPRLLLEYGCRAVVASPWSLQVSVARPWLPKFLEALEGGSTVIESVYHANQQVGKKLGSHPSLQLAMHVFGDPLFSLPRAV